MTIPGRVYEITDPQIEATYRHRSFMGIAKKAVVKSTFDGPRMSSVITSGGRVLSVGVNKLRSGHLKSKYYTANQAHHAELDAWLNCGRDSLKGAVVYVYGVGKGGVPCWSSRSCPSCEKLLKSLGVKAVVYHDTNENLYMLKF